MAVKLFDSQEPLTCAHCGKNLFEEPGIVVFIENEFGDYTDVYTCCKGRCDEVLQKRIGENESDGWKDVTDFMNPLIFLKEWMAVMNNIYEGKKFEAAAYEKFKDILIAAAPYVLRQPTDGEKRSYQTDMMIPF